LSDATEKIATVNAPPEEMKAFQAGLRVGYKTGYAAGYQDGYVAATMPTIEPAEILHRKLE